MNKTIQDLKMEIETMKKSQRETALKLENLGKRSEVIGASIINRIQEIEERISGVEDSIENTDTTVKMQKQKATNPKYSGISRYYVKIKPKSNRNKRG